MTRLKKALKLAQDNINLISCILGIAFVLNGKAEIGQILISQGL